MCWFCKEKEENKLFHNNLWWILPSRVILIINSMIQRNTIQYTHQLAITKIKKWEKSKKKLLISSNWELHIYLFESMKVFDLESSSLVVVVDSHKPHLFVRSNIFSSSHPSLPFNHQLISHELYQFEPHHSQVKIKDNGPFSEGLFQ